MQQNKTFSEHSVYRVYLLISAGVVQKLLSMWSLLVLQLQPVKPAGTAAAAFAESQLTLFVIAFCRW